MGTWVVPDCRLTANALSCALVAAMASGCSTIGDGSGGGADGAPTAGSDATGARSDAEVPLGPFSEPRLIEALSDPLAGDADPSMNEDGRELFFSSNRTGSAGTDIWVSERDTIDDDWGEPRLVVELDSADAELDREVSFDGLTIYLNSLDLYIATRATAEDVWDTPAPLSIDSGAQEADAWLSADGLTLYFNSNRTGGSGDSDTYRTTRLSTGSLLFADPDELGEVNSEFHEANVALARGGRYLVMSSARGGDHELWEASR